MDSCQKWITQLASVRAARCTPVIARQAARRRRYRSAAGSHRGAGPGKQFDVARVHRLAAVCTAQHARPPAIRTSPSWAAAC